MHVNLNKRNQDDVMLSVENRYANKVSFSSFHSYHMYFPDFHQTVKQ